MAPWINNEYSLFALFFLTLIFFIFSSDLNIKKIIVQIFKSLFKKKEESLTPTSLMNDRVDEELSLIEKPQQSFIFENEEKEVKAATQTKNQIQIAVSRISRKKLFKAKLARC